MAELRVTSTGTIKLFESDDTSSVTIASPASLGGDRTITLPDANVDLTEVNTMPIANLDIDGGTDIGANIADSDLLIIDDGAGGTNRKTAASRIKTYVGAGAGAFDIGNLDIDGGTDIGAAITDSDLFIIDDGAGGTNRKTAASRLKTYIGGGTLVEVAQSSISAGSSTAAVEFSNIFSSSYNTYFVRISKIRFVGNTSLQMRFYSDTSTTEFTGSYYYWGLYGRDVGGNTITDQTNGQDRFYLTSAGVDQDQPADGGLTGFMYIDNPLANDNFSATAYGQMLYRTQSDVYTGHNFFGFYSGSSARYGFKLYGSENVEYADITVYGVAP